MFSKVAFFITTALALSVAASSETENTCNTGKIQCCNSAHYWQSQAVEDRFRQLEVKVEGLTGDVGFDCSPITVVGSVKGSDCAAKPLCCEENKGDYGRYAGLIEVNCSPIDIDV